MQHHGNINERHYLCKLQDLLKSSLEKTYITQEKYNTLTKKIREALNNKQKVCSNEKLRKLIARDDRHLKDNVGSWTILHNMVEKILKPNGFVLYYQVANSHEPENSSARYYQLTVSDEFWLRNGRDFGKICIGLDGKYDLNIDHAPVLSIVVENNAGCGTPLAFGMNFYYFIIF